MPLASGARLGPYEIVGPLGAGGMGEVYRARDTQLDRDVAIKILPEAVAQNPERLARFEREAKVLAALNHPNIAQIYGVEQGALVMELVEGETLSGPLPAGIAVNYARQIADAIEAAHEKSIVHRDLKPANIKVTPQGVIKVLDFGLAAVTQSTASRSDASISPTLTLAATQMGVLLGTAGYMSPEQAAGKPVDKRADIWSFGVVLWEMFTGRRLFDGETVSHTLAAVLTKELDWTQLPAGVPPGIRKLLKRCLERDLRRRLPDIGAARLELEDAMAGASEIATPVPAHSSRVPWAAAAALAVIAAIFAFLYFRPVPRLDVLRYTIAVPQDSILQSFAISPDGRMVVISAIVNGKRQLWLRRLDALQAQPILSTEGGANPFWSPDSRYIGYFGQGKLRKIAASGGPPQSLCDVDTQSRGGTWNRDDVIVFSPGGSIGGALQRVSAAGGTPADVLKTPGFSSFPHFLPDGRHFLFVIGGGPAEASGIWVASLNGKERRRLLPDVSGVVFAPALAALPGIHRTGHLLFLRENNLMAQPFDAGSAQLAGDAFPVAEGVSFLSATSYAPVTVSENGVLIYSGGGFTDMNQIGWYDRAGKPLGPALATGPVWTPALSPDEKAIAFSRVNGTVSDLWIRDLAHGVDRRFTSNTARNDSPVWSPAGDRIAFRSLTAHQDLYQKEVSGSRPEEVLRDASNPNNKFPAQWSRDGKFLVYIQLVPKTRQDLWVLPLNPAGQPIPFLQTGFNETQGQLSPDSHWMAYTSDESGQREIYVRPFPTADGVWRISLAGGEHPRWRGDGKELFFVAADGKMMAVPVKSAQPAGTGKPAAFETGTPQALFETHIVTNTVTSAFQYDVTADGKRFLITTSASSGTATPLIVNVNWNAAAGR